MFVLKYGFDFGLLRRRGIESVRAELTEKVIAYNFCRMIQIEHQRRKKAGKLAA